ncbi:MAG: hypothetical protein FVQ81_05495 [Candidatus Glassbacteria bacterium]|nr:hypothetical protein [Candidatus Glassbacteria bacterium]
MRYDGSDILFEFFFQPGYTIDWVSEDSSLRLDVESSAESSGGIGLRIFTVELDSNDLRLAIESSVSSGFDTVFAVQAISISEIGLNVEKTGWLDSGISLELTAANSAADYQALFHIREEDWFTN